ncbi:allergen Fus c 3, partial [Cladorrhinum samala]
SKGPTQDSVSKRAPSRGKGKTNAALKKEEPWEFEDQEGSMSNTTPRARHNLVEQKYRHRLNAHFDQLLEVLPNSMSEIPGQPILASASSPDQAHHLSRETRFERERKVSKAEVLDRARLYIQSLENDTRRLMADQEELKARWEEY